MHFKLSMLLGLLSCFAVSWLKARCIKSGLLLFVIMQLLLVFGLFVDEAHQFIATSRRFEWMDLYYGLSGLVAGSVFYAVLLLLKHYLGLLFKRA